MRGQRFVITVNLIRALGGSWDSVADVSKEPVDKDKVESVAPPAVTEEKPVEQKPTEAKSVEEKPAEESDKKEALPIDTTPQIPVSCGNSPIKSAC